MKKIYFIIALFLALTSCNNWLDVELDNKVDDHKLFSTPQGFKEALAGIYSQMSKPSLYGSYLTMEHIDALSQYYSASSTYEYWVSYDYANSGTKSTIRTMWNGLYSNISQANCILEWADRNANVLSDEERDQIRGEALALRAFLHFDLYRLFAPDVKRAPKADGIPYNKIFGVSTICRRPRSVWKTTRSKTSCPTPSGLPRLKEISWTKRQRTRRTNTLPA